MVKKFLDNVNLITGQEKIILDFKIEKVKEGIEEIYIKNNPIDNDFMLAGLDEEEKKKIKIIEKKNFIIKDDYGDAGGNNRIGTTLTNLLNKSDDILIILEKYINLIKETQKEQIKEICIQISNLINKFKLKKLDINKVLYLMYEMYNVTDNIKLIKYAKEDKGLLMNKEIIIQYENIKKSQYFTIIDNFLDELYLLEEENIDKIDLITLVDIILNQSNGLLETFYKELLLKTTKKMENELKKCLNLPLQYLLQQIFNVFYKDYNSLNKDENNLLEFWKNIHERYRQRPYNTYYRETLKYMNNLYDKSINRIKEVKKMPKRDIELPKKFEEFSYNDITSIFVESLIYDMKFMIENYEQNEENKEGKKFLDFTNIPLMKSPNDTSTYEIFSLNELFYVSMYYILENKTTLKRCKTCNKIFIAKKPNRDKNCQRKCPENNKYTCREYADKNYRKGKETENEVSRISNKIYSLIERRLYNGKIDDNKYNELLKKRDNLENKYKDSEEVLLKKLEEFHFKLKNNINL